MAAKRKTSTKKASAKKKTTKQECKKLHLEAIEHVDNHPILAELDDLMAEGKRIKTAVNAILDQFATAAHLPILQNESIRNKFKDRLVEIYQQTHRETKDHYQALFQLGEHAELHIYTMADEQAYMKQYQQTNNNNDTKHTNDAYDYQQYIPSNQNKKGDK